MVFNEYGEIVNKYWLEIPKHFNNVELDEFVIMPNHVHGIIIIRNSNQPVGNDHRVVPNNDKYVVPNLNESVGHDGPTLQKYVIRQQQLLFRIIQWFKTITTNAYIKGVKNNQFPPFDKRIWQRSYYDHIIRNEHSLFRIRKYIKNNPINWQNDKNNLG
jgi:REP element-mobilizing transposase RayT